MPVCKKVAIIGAGVSGLAALKSCLEAGLDPVAFEWMEGIGGTWRYRDQDQEGLTSVTASTCLVSCKELNAFSDFPPPAEYPLFSHNTLMFDYLVSYAKHFDLYRHIHFGCQVLRVEPDSSYEVSGRWVVAVRKLKEGETSVGVYDAVIVCVGQLSWPRKPKFEGLDGFRGKVIHSQSYRRPEGFARQRVLVVGIGNSAADVICDLVPVAKKVFLSAHRKFNIIPMIQEDGVPYDMSSFRKINFIPRKRATFSMYTVEQTEDALSGKSTFTLTGLRPVPLQGGIFSCDLHPLIALKKIDIRGKIACFTEDGVIFQGESQVEPLDAVILATGYTTHYPFLSADLANQKNLYKHVFPTDLKHLTLAFVGSGRILGPKFSAYESQARWVSLIFSGCLPCPTAEQILSDHKVRAKLSRLRPPGHCDDVLIPWYPYVDDLNGLIGTKPQMLRLLLTDPVLFYACVFGPWLPYQFRLHGRNAWSGAREAILKCTARAPPVYKSQARFHFKDALKIIAATGTLFGICIYTVTACTLQSYIFSIVS